jgi:peptidoglycan/LPS O-acetylase OafA/YrhL
VAKDLLFVGSASAAVLLGRLVTKPSAVSRALGSRAMVALGKLSYSLFLVHYPVFRTLARIGPENAIVSAVIGWTLSFALAVVSYMLIEQGVLRLKRRLSPARAAT